MNENCECFTCLFADDIDTIEELRREYILKKTFCCTYYGHESDYPKLDGVDIIEVSKSRNIPNDYFGDMAVPISALDIIDRSVFDVRGMLDKPTLNDKALYKRILIRIKPFQHLDGLPEDRSKIRVIVRRRI